MCIKMSLFKAIRGTFSTVQKDISKGLKSLQQPDSKKVASKFLKEGVDIETGTALLNIYEDAWADIHRSLEDSAKQSKVVYSDIREISQHYEKQGEDLTRFQTELSSLPQLIESFSGLVQQLSTLEEDFNTIEHMLLSLEDVCEQHELITNKHRHYAQLEVYKQQKHIEVEQAKIDFAKKHAKDVQAYESNIQETLREKQKVFEETYEQEIEKYKQSGEINIKPAAQSSTSDQDLADISVEQDASELEKFLEAEEENAKSDSYNRDEGKTTPKSDNKTEDGVEITTD